MKDDLPLKSNTLKPDEDVMTRIAAVNEGVWNGHFTYIMYVLQLVDQINASASDRLANLAVSQ